MFLSFFYVALASVFAADAAAASIESSFRSISRKDLKSIKADHWSIAGNNIVVSGNVFVPMGVYDIRADKAVINMSSKDIDAVGNIQVFRRVAESISVTPSQLAKIENMPNVSCRVTGISTSFFGEQKLKLEVSRIDGSIKAQKFSGNLSTGYFSFSDAELMLGTLVCRAKSGERLPSGIIKVHDAEVSACGYLASQNAHYSLACSEAELTPYNTTSFSTDDAVTAPGEYSLMAQNCTVRVYGVPVLWLPVFYKPKDENLGLFQIQVGQDSDWGFYALLSKRFTPLDYPATTVRVKADFYERRGFGYGASVQSKTENSRTEIFAYSINDERPYLSSDADDYDISIPHQRYDFRISHLTHITPTLDFRGNFEIMSDEFINHDFFSNYYDANPQPVTFASLEKQFDLFSASIYVRPRVNSFFSAVEQLPTGRIDVPRQEIFDTNIYYQGETSIGYFRNRWSDYNDSDHKKVLFDFAEYESARFDTMHFFYYPVKLDFLNIVPRAGFRFTIYSNTSENEVSDNDLARMIMTSDPGYNRYGSNLFASYDNNGGGKVRFVGEFGLELNTKIYNSWQDIRSSFLQLDGLRHVIVPYINYTYIPKPTLDREHIYYFDDIDRIDKQHFIRFGLINRLQTRRNDQIVNYFVMENYWDYHIEPQDGFDSIGNFCTKLTANPIKGLTISSFFSFAFGDDENPIYRNRDIIRGNYNAGHPGLYWSNLNRLDFNLRYEPVQDFVFNLRYEYQNRYRSQSAYSMGSSLSDIESGSAFNKYYQTQTQELIFGVGIPLTPDRRTFGKYQVTYDFNSGFISEQTFSIVRRFHCVEVAAEYSIETELDGGEKETEHNFYIIAQLSGLVGPADDAQNALLASAVNKQKNGEWF